MNVHGIILVDGEFSRGETISVAGADLSGLARGSVRYADDGAFGGVIGVITDARRILGPEDCVRDSDWLLLDVAQGRPFVRASAKLIASGVLPFIEKMGVSALTWSAVGHILERNGNHIARTFLRDISLTPATIDPGAYRIFPGVG